MPINGSIKGKNASAGDYVRTGRQIFSIVQINPLKLSFSIPEKDSRRISLGQEVIIGVDAYEGERFNGRVTAVSPHADEKTRTVQIEAQIPNPHGKLKPGFFAKTIPYTARQEDAILVPVTSLLYEGDIVKVFVIEGDMAHERRIKIGQVYTIKSRVEGQDSKVKTRGPISPDIWRHTCYTRSPSLSEKHKDNHHKWISNPDFYYLYFYNHERLWLHIQ